MNPHLHQPGILAGAPIEQCRAVAVLIHGRGRTPDEMIDLAAQFDLPDIAYIALSAAEQSWYPLSFLEPIERNQPLLAYALEAYHTQIERLRERGIPPERITLIGFSQGACLTAEYAMRNPTRYGAICLFTGGLAGPAGSTWQISDRIAGAPLLIGGATHDSWVPLVRMQETAAAFRQAGADVETCFYPGNSHIVSPQEIAAARRLLRAV